MATKSKKLMKVIDGIRSWNTNTSQPIQSTKSCIKIEEPLKCEHIQIGKVAVHGFPYQPMCMAFDAVQKIIAIGTKTGVIRIFGRPGVDYIVFHPSSSAVIQIIFLINEGGLISICRDDVVHLWNIRQKTPELVHSLQFKREHLTYGNVPAGSGWLYLGTDKGNVHFVNIQRFATSGYVINWNKAIDISQSTHPGHVVQIGENPADPNKLLIGFSTGFLVHWDLRSKSADARFKYNERLYGFAWHWEGKSFMTCHGNGLLATWSLKQTQRPVSVTCPHAGGDELPSDLSIYEPIYQVAWLPPKNGGDYYIIFSGGSELKYAPSPSSVSNVASPLQTEEVSPLSIGASDVSPAESVSPIATGSFPLPPNPSLVVKRGRRSVVMELDYPLVQFTSLCCSPYVSESMDPYAVAILLQRDLVVLDLQSPNYATFENPYPMDINSSPVTACMYLVDCPGDLVPAYYSVGNRCQHEARSQLSDQDAFSSREWPINGGEWGMSYNPYTELILTGHADGSVRFWDASEMTLTPLYKVRTAKFFNPSHSSNRPSEVADSATTTSPDDRDPPSAAIRSPSSGPTMLSPFTNDSDYLAIRHISFCAESRRLLTASIAHVCLLNFSRREQSCEIPVMDLNMIYDNLDDSALHYVGSCDAFADDQFEPGASGTMTKDSVFQASTASAGRNLSGSRTEGSVSSFHSAVNIDARDGRAFVPTRPGSITWPPGYHPTVICRLGVPTSDQAGIPFIDPSLSITAVCLNSSFGLFAVGNEYGMAVIDYVNRVCLLSTSCADLCGPMELYSKLSLNRSPGRSGTNTDVKFAEQSVDPEVSHDALSVTTGHSIASDNQQSISMQPVYSPASDLSSHMRQRKTKERSADFSSPFSGFHLCDLQADVKQQKASTRRFTKWTPKGAEAKEFNSSPIDCQQLHTISRIASRLAIAYRTSAIHRQQLSTVNQQSIPSEKCPDFPSSPVSCSLSGSTTSLEQQLSSEAIRVIVFCDSYTRKQDGAMGPCIWIGTARGNVLAIKLHPSDIRSSTVHALIPTGTIFRLNGEIVFLGFLDHAGELVSYPSERWEDSSATNSRVAPHLTKQASVSSNPVSDSGSIASGFRQGESSVAARRLGTDNTASKGSRDAGSSKPMAPRTSSSSTSSSSGPSGPSSSHQQSTLNQPPSALSSPEPNPSKTMIDVDRQLLVICSEKQAHVVALPSQTCLFKAKITETSSVVRASIQRLRFGPSKDNVDLSGTTCFLACYLANGHFMALSLPSLRVLIDCDFLPYTEPVARSFAFGQHGQVIYLSSPSELLKCTWSADICANLRDMQGELFLPCNMPEPPKKGFFKNLLSGTLTSSIDRDELFGEAATGKGNITTSTLLPNTRMEKLGGSASGAASEISRARQAAIERGERLQQLDLQTQEMSDQAKSFGQTAALLAAKYEKKDKRWGWPL